MICPDQARAAHPARDIDIILPDASPPSAARMLADLFRTTNEILGAPVYRVSVHRLAAQPCADPRRWTRRTVILLGDIRTRWSVTGPLRPLLRVLLAQAPRRVLVGGAVFLLSDAGLARGCALAIHPNFRAAAAEEGLEALPDAPLSGVAGPVASAVSGFAAVPLMLDLIAEDHGQVTANALRAYLGLPAPEAQSRSRLSLGLLQRARGDRLIDRSLALMQEHIEEPLRIGDLARMLGVSTRKLQRQFLELTGEGPLSVYRALRIERARQLLEQTNLPLVEIIAATGFGTHSNLARWVRKEHGVSPHALRQRAMSGRAA
ncbi:helix-turn-helix domain-containing protein [Ruegeria pomeroyi]|uniref:helix-turn-helix domain-containing protein n=1 Tax=Ruegeria pomeroyi TaxID=89184 RepID=UPI001F1FF8C8|nr:helix-turn-helix domain-containing protein [Ruegeria pomeroyi]